VPQSIGKFRLGADSSSGPLRPGPEGAGIDGLMSRLDRAPSQETSGARTSETDQETDHLMAPFLVCCWLGSGEFESAL
jgi:hypothetical protein